MARPTIADVARAAGVSKSTVSRVLNGNLKYIRPGTLEQVRQAIAELGYQPSTVARSLTLKRTHTAGLLISDIGNPFYAEVIHGVEDVALDRGYDVFLCNTGYSAQRGMAFIHSLANKQVDGILIMSSSMSDEWLAELDRRQVPVVVLDWPAATQYSSLGAMGLISVDYNIGIQQAVDHLIELGHRRLAHVSGPLQLRTSLLRQDAFIRAATGHGLHPGRIAVVEGNLRIDGGKSALQHVMQMAERPTAIFSANDLTAMGVVWAARDMGLRVPEDLSVVGLDDIALAAEINSPLTTVSMPRNQIGRMAMQMLLELIDAEPSEAGIQRQSEVTTRLVVRGSTG